MSATAIIYDLVGIGLGPFNLGLAALASPLPGLKTLFFEQNESFEWHPGLMLDGATLQVPFLADLVSLVDPTHPLSFLQYLHVHRRLYKFYFLEDFYVTREEYNHYCQWACTQLDNLHFSQRVTQVEKIQHQGEALLRLTVQHVKDGSQKIILTRHLSLGIGTMPYVPEALRDIDNEFIQHSANYLNFREQKLANSKSVCVIGSGQSAAEIILDLLNRHDAQSRQILWATRSRGFFPMEYSKFGLEHFSPEYMQYFYNLDDETKKKLISKQTLMYKGISQKTISDIFEKLYQMTIGGKKQPLTFHTHSDLRAIEKNADDAASRFKLHCFQWQTSQWFNLECDAVVMATGYRAPHPAFLASLEDELISGENQAYMLNEDFSIRMKHVSPNKIFVQNNSLFSHGIGSPDLGLGCYRNSIILNRITQRECYPVHYSNVFQSFTAPDRSSQCT